MVEVYFIHLSSCCCSISSGEGGELSSAAPYLSTAPSLTVFAKSRPLLSGPIRSVGFYLNPSRNIVTSHGVLFYFFPFFSFFLSLLPGWKRNYGGNNPFFFGGWLKVIQTWVPVQWRLDTLVITGLISSHLRSYLACHRDCRLNVLSVVLNQVYLLCALIVATALIRPKQNNSSVTTCTGNWPRHSSALHTGRELGLCRGSTLLTVLTGLFDHLL